MLEITILGCGSSLGVPLIGCKCNVCTSKDPRNKRRRSAIYIKSNTESILIDFGYDIKDQLIDADVTFLDAAILTHHHADHVAGIDNLKIFSYLQNKPLTIITDNETSKLLESRHSYLFNENLLALKPVDFYSSININNLQIQFFKQYHGAMNCMGIKINDFVYSIDVTGFPEESKQYLQNLDVWIIDCIDIKSTATHSGLNQVLIWREEFSPKKIYLSNMNHNINYYDIMSILPSDVVPLYDRLKFNTN